jgi:hypothetical protein
MNMKQLIVCIFCLMTVSAASYGQLNYSMTTLSDGNGNPLMTKKAASGETAHLFNANYLDAVIYIKDNEKPIRGNKFKLNLQQNRLFFLDKDGDEMEVASPITRIEFTGDAAPTVFERGFPPIDKLNSDHFYQVLIEGKAVLLVDTKFEEVEYKVYNSATTAKRIDKLVSFYGATGNKIVRITKPEDVLLLLGDKTKQMSDYFKQENIKVKKQADLEKVFKYYNSIAVGG